MHGEPGQNVRHMNYAYSLQWRLGKCYVTRYLKGAINTRINGANILSEIGGGFLPSFWFCKFIFLNCIWKMTWLDYFFFLICCTFKTGARFSCPLCSLPLPLSPFSLPSPCSLISILLSPPLLSPSPLSPLLSYIPLPFSPLPPLPSFFLFLFFPSLLSPFSLIILPPCLSRFIWKCGESGTRQENIFIFLGSPFLPPSEGQVSLFFVFSGCFWNFGRG